MTVIAEQQGPGTQSAILGFHIQAIVALYRRYNTLILLQKQGNATL
jgi:hypothetical protein